MNRKLEKLQKVIKDLSSFSDGRKASLSQEEHEKVLDAVNKTNFFRGTVYSLVFGLFELQLILFFDLAALKAETSFGIMHAFFLEHLELLAMALVFLFTVHYKKKRASKSPHPAERPFIRIFLTLFLSSISVLTLTDVLYNGKLAIFLYTMIIASCFMFVSFPRNLYVLGLPSLILLLGQWFLPLSLRTHLYLSLNLLVLFIACIFVSCRVYKDFYEKTLTAFRLTQANERLDFLASHDSLTGLLNRRSFEKAMEANLEAMKTKGDEGFLILLDIDHFKLVNDNFGHLAGDRVLIKLAQIIKSELSDQDLAARWGGEEFIVFLPKTPADSGLAFAEKLRNHFERLILKTEDHKDICVTGSFGASYLSPLNRRNFRELYRQVDENLYKAKTTGRNRVVLTL